MYIILINLPKYKSSLNPHLMVFQVRKFKLHTVSSHLLSVFFTPKHQLYNLLLSQTEQPQQKMHLKLLEQVLLSWANKENELLINRGSANILWTKKVGFGANQTKSLWHFRESVFVVCLKEEEEKMCFWFVRICLNF